MVTWLDRVVRSSENAWGEARFHQIILHVYMLFSEAIEEYPMSDIVFDSNWEYNIKFHQIALTFYSVWQ